MKDIVSDGELQLDAFRDQVEYSGYKLALKMHLLPVLTSEEQIQAALADVQHPMNSLKIWPSMCLRWMKIQEMYA